MIVRNPTAAEVERAAEVASIAFPNLSLEHWQGSFNMVAEVFGTRFILVVEDEGEIVSTLLCQPQPVYVNGCLVSHASTGAVATIPEARCKGCAGAMMAETVRLLRDEGVYLSSLWPFSYEYYRKFGWEVGSEVRGYSAEAKVFAELGDADNARIAIDEDYLQIKLVYDDWAQGYNCLTQRSDVWWDRVVPFRMEGIQAEDKLVVHVTDGDVDAYAAYRLNDGPSINVLEMVATQSAHRRDMLAWLAGTVAPETRISFGAPIDDLFIQELPNPRLLSAGVSPSFQFRVTDPPKALEALAVDEDLSGRVTFSITDPVFKQGWDFGVEVEDGKVQIVKPDPNQKLEVSVMTFARLYSGYLTPFDALELGMLKAGDAVENVFTACEIFPPLTPYRTSLEPG